MRLKNLFWALFAFLTYSVLSPQSSLLAAFEDTGTGARGVALGDNYASMGDEVLSLFYNPAELARVHQKEIGTEYSRLYTGLSDGSNLSQYTFGYGQPIQWGGTLAFGWKQFSLDDLYKERTLSLGYGEWLTSNIAIGGALKQLYHSFGAPHMVVDDNGNIQSGTPSFFAQNGNSNTAYSADLGVLYRMTEQHTVGVSVQDINEPNIALNPADHEVVSRTLRMSMAYDTYRHMVLAGSMMTKQSLASQRDYTWTGSAEKWWPLAGGDQVSLRGSLATGSRQFQQGTVGGGYRMRSFQIDYAFVFNLTGVTPGNTMGTHRFSLTYRFGPLSSPTQAKAKSKKRTKKPMPQGYEQKDVEPQTGLPRSADIHLSPEDLEKQSTRAPLPRAAEITITPEEIEQESVSPKAADISIDAIFDTDFDGIDDDHDLCPNTPAGFVTDARGCAQSQLDHHGNPFPKKVRVDFLPLDEVEHGTRIK